MRTHVLAIAVLVQSTGVAAADPHKLTLDEVMAKALAGPRARTARGTAETAEAQLKKWSRRKKEALIESNIEELKVAARKDWQAYRERRGKEK